MGYAKRRDATEPAIIKALRKSGALVMQLNEFDILCYRAGKLFMLDAKTGKGKATDAQQRMIDQGWPLTFVRDEMEALRAIQAIQETS